MLASSTVENYLKAIYAGVARLGHGQRLLPMGQLAAAVGVTPGTATTMVKTLAESGLVEYEPYAGVALTAAGQKLAALVLRRHRLIELPSGSEHGLIGAVSDAEHEEFSRIAVELAHHHQLRAEQRRDLRADRGEDLGGWCSLCHERRNAS